MQRVQCVTICANRVLQIAIAGDAQSIVGRPNANGVDLNRNFPDQFKTTKDNRVQTVETIAVMEWIQTHSFVLSANLHGGSIVANYPYDDTRNGQSTYSKCPDDDIFQQLAETYSTVRYCALFCRGHIAYFSDGH